MINLIIVIQLLIIFYLGDTIRKIHEAETYVKSDIDNREYNVIDMEDKDIAADKLASVNNYNQTLIDHMYGHCIDEPDSKTCILGGRLKRRYNPDALVENDPTDIKNTAYTEDKGRLIALCLRDRYSGEKKIHDDDIINFVSMHELAHVASRKYGHGPEFWSNFKHILTEAKDIGYIPKNYKKEPEEYCGLIVTSNPYFNNKY
jgi:hypothetical protein